MAVDYGSEKSRLHLKFWKGRVSVSAPAAIYSALLGKFRPMDWPVSALCHASSLWRGGVFSRCYAHVWCCPLETDIAF